MSNCNINQNYSVDINSNVSLHLRDKNPFTQLNTVNGELWKLVMNLINHGCLLR